MSLYQNRGGQNQALACGVLCIAGMSTITFRVSHKNGDYVKPTLVPANHSEEPHFGLLDGAIVSFFLLSTGGLIYLLLQV